MSDHKIKKNWHDRKLRGKQKEILKRAKSHGSKFLFRRERVEKDEMTLDLGLTTFKYELEQLVPEDRDNLTPSMWQYLFSSKRVNLWLISTNKLFFELHEVNGIKLYLKLKDIFNPDCMRLAITWIWQRFGEEYVFDDVSEFFHYCLTPVKGGYEYALTDERFERLRQTAFKQINFYGGMVLLNRRRASVKGDLKKLAHIYNNERLSKDFEWLADNADADYEVWDYKY